MKTENRKKREKILFVCTGNTCRSPMAEAALRKELRRRKIAGYSIGSAGIKAEVNSKMSLNSAQALAEAKISVLKSFHPRQLTEKLIRESKIVICMTSSQERLLEKYSNVTSFPALSGMEIPDPYGKDINVYRLTLRRIRECLPLIIEKYCTDETEIRKSEESI